MVSNIFLCSSPFGKMIQFDKYFSDGLKLPTSVSMCLNGDEMMKYFVHIMEKYLEETATYLDDPNFLKLHRLKRRFSRAALFPGIVRVPRTFRYNSFRIHKTQETSVLNIGLSCSAQAAGRLLPKKTMAATEHSGH